MPTISWNESTPAGADSVGIGAAEIRSTKTALRTALDAEHNFPAAGGDAGVHRLGSARPYVGLQSAVSSSGTDGRLFWASDTSTFYHVGSGGTAFIGGGKAISAGTYPSTLPQRHVWVMEFGEGKCASGSTTITIPNSGYSGVPFVTVTPRVTSLIGDGGAPLMWLSSMGNSSFNVNSRLTDWTSSSNHSFYWHSFGSRVL